jgi:fumarate reductase flavoprotein subunit
LRIGGGQRRLQASVAAGEDMPKLMSKRRLLSTGAGVGAASLWRGALAAAPGDQRYDLIVVGGGNAGLPTAIFAAARGAKVLIVEAGASVGGTLYLSSGQMSAAGTKLQAAKGIQDTPQIHYDDVMRISGNTADPVLLRLAVDNAAPTFDWLTDSGLVVMPEHPVTGTSHEPYSRERYAWAKTGGRAILEVLKAQMKPHVDAGGITVLANTKATALIQDAHGAVTGIKARKGDGPVVDHAARSVALTCGGYTFNPAMYQTYENAPIYTNASYPQSKGAGVTLGLAAGGYVRGGQNHTPLFGAILEDTRTPCAIRAMIRHFPGKRPPWEIIVGADGKRFMQEDVLSHNVYEQSLRAQPGERCFIVFDDAIFKQAPDLVQGIWGGAWTPADTAKAFDNGTPYFSRADTVEGLAARAGMDSKALAATVAAYNAVQGGQGQDAFGRKHMPLPIAKGPFYAIELRGWDLLSYAGLAVDGKLRVVRKDGTPIPGLYAAGELLGMGQLSGRSACGGMSVTPALSLGRLLGGRIVPV